MKCINKYIEEEKEIFKKSNTKLFAELLYLNYQFRNTDCFESNARFILRESQEHLKFTEKEYKEILIGGIKLLEEKYNIKVNNLDNLIYEKIK